jgi:S1-C subfamily serine protease
VLNETLAKLTQQGATNIVFGVQLPLRDIVGAVKIRQVFLAVPWDLVAINNDNDLALLKTKHRIGPKGIHSKATVEIEGVKESFEMLETSTVTIHQGIVDTGDEVAVAGFPLASPHFLVQEGIVSATPITPVLNTERETEEIVVDIMVNPGNSGGPAFLSATGYVIGLCRAHRLAPTVSTSAGEASSVLQNSGLGLVTPSKFLVQLMQNHGVQPTIK